MRAFRILAFVVVIALAGTSFGQLTFDFEGVTIQDLTDSGWVFHDEIGTGDPVQTYPGTIQIETTIVHGGSAALRLGFIDVAYYPLNGEFGTLDFWMYDFGYQVHAFLAGGAGYGPRGGLRKHNDHQEYPGPYAFGIGAGLCDKVYLDSDGGYAIEWGNTNDAVQVVYDQDPTAFPGPWDPHGWPGNQSWFSPYYGGYMPNGRPDAMAMEAGWNHWSVAYLAPGVVEIFLLESWAGDSTSPTGTPGNAFDGTVAGGVEDIYLFGGSTANPAPPSTLFGDGIFDDITWTPSLPPLQADFDGDGDVDLDDFVILKNGFGTGTTHAEGDADLDGDVDLDDFVILKQEFGS